MSDSTSDLLEEICTERESVDSPTLEQIVILAVEIAREGREGRKIGTIFTVGDSEAVLEHSRPMILDPLQGHASADTSIKSANVRETLKELAQLDGAFVIDNRGTALSAARYLDADTAGIDMPLGLGSRHMAGAAITKHTGCVSVVVSTSAIVRLFDNGELVAEVIPELWILNRYSSHIDAPLLTRSDEQMTVLSRME
jgi:DNA integrity scanning protein DisA with diadenylate cyclase activity